MLAAGLIPNNGLAGELSKDEVTQLNLGTGVPMIYSLNADTTVASKEIPGEA